jgi:hypothetical protein
MAEDRAPVCFRRLLQLLVEGNVDFIEALIATKESAGRPKDRAVLDLLRETLAQQQADNGD